MSSITFLGSIGAVLAAVVTGYQFVVLALQPVLASPAQQRVLASVFRSFALVLTCVFLALVPNKRTAPVAKVDLTLQVGLFVLIVCAPGYELLVHIHETNGERESLEALEQEGRLLLLSICGFLMVAVAEAINWVVYNRNESAASAKIGTTAASLLPTGGDGVAGPGDDTQPPAPIRLAKAISDPQSPKPGPWDNVVKVGCEDLLRFANSEDWISKSEVGQVQVWRKELPMTDGGVPPIKVSGVVQGVDPYTLCTCFQSLEFKRNSSDTIKELRVVEEVNSTTKIYYQEDNYPWPLSNRDTLFVSTVQEEQDGSIILAEWSLPSHPSLEGENANATNVRVPTYDVYIFSKHGDGDSLVTVASNIEQGGQIPKFVVEDQVQKLPKIFEQVAMFFESEEGKAYFSAVKHQMNRAVWSGIFQNLTPVQRNFLEHNCPPFDDLRKYTEAEQ